MRSALLGRNLIEKGIVFNLHKIFDFENGLFRLILKTLNFNLFFQMNFFNSIKLLSFIFAIDSARFLNKNNLQGCNLANCNNILPFFFSKIFYDPQTTTTTNGWTRNPIPHLRNTHCLSIIISTQDETGESHITAESAHVRFCVIYFSRISAASEREKKVCRSESPADGSGISLFTWFSEAKMLGAAPGPGHVVFVQIMSGEPTGQNKEH